mgnify:CR=1 FL=1
MIIRNFVMFSFYSVLVLSSVTIRAETQHKIEQHNRPEETSPALALINLIPPLKLERASHVRPACLIET